MNKIKIPNPGNTKSQSARHHIHIIEYVTMKNEAGGMINICIAWYFLSLLKDCKRI